MLALPYALFSWDIFHIFLSSFSSSVTATLAHRRESSATLRAPNRYHCNHFAASYQLGPTTGVNAATLAADKGIFLAGFLPLRQLLGHFRLWRGLFDGADHPNL